MQESARGAGIGSALIRSCTERYFPLGYFLVYGQFRTGSGLETYFPRFGFEVLGPGQSLPLQALMPIHVRPELGEQLFTLIRLSSVHPLTPSSRS